VTDLGANAVTREATPDLLGEPFRFDSIIEAPAPEGGEGVWHQYVIVQGTNRIVGLRAGSRSEVSLHVEGVVAQLNERFRKGKAGAASGYGRAKPASPSVGGAGTQPAPVSEAAREDVV
jgi:hypothetical protein